MWLYRLLYILAATRTNKLMKIKPNLHLRILVKEVNYEYLILLINNIIRNVFADPLFIGL